MNKTVRIVLGGILVVLGILFALQGAGAMGGSGGMNGKTIWVFLGAIIAIVGAALIVRSVRPRTNTR